MKERLERLGQGTAWSVVGPVLGLGVFALSLPLLELLGRHPEFFIARRLPSLDILALAIGLAVLPAAAAVPVLLLRLWGPVPAAVGHVFVLAAIGSLAGAATLIAGGAGGWPWPVFAVVAAAVGILVAIGYLRFPLARTALRYLGLAPVAVVAWFALVAPVSAVVFGPAAGDVEGASPRNPAPIVMLVFDEFPAASITRADGGLDVAHYPNFARLAADGVWHRNAISVRQQTEEALPTIVTGRAVAEGSIPTTADHPFNLFTLLSDTYDVAAVENVTNLCPDYACANASRPVDPVGERWATMVPDVTVVYGHLLLPDELGSGLPPLDAGWGGFRQAGGGDFDIITRFLDFVDDDRRRELDRFLDTFDRATGEPPLRFAHFLYPHHPWDIDPDGRLNLADRPPGRFEVGWGDDEFLVAQGRQRHLLAVQWSDELLGRVLDRMQEGGLYDDALIVVAADHGIAITPGVHHQRVVLPETIGSIAAVPLLVKYPAGLEGGPVPGTVDTTRAETTDILPTIADVIGARIPWPVDGVSLRDVEERSQRERTVVVGTSGAVEVPPDDSALLGEAAEKERWFPAGDPYAFTPPGWAHLLDSPLDGGTQLPINQQALLDAHVAGSDPVPSLLSGTVPAEGGDHQVVAVTAHGVVVAVTRTYADGDVVRWEASVPASYIDDDPAAIAAWLVGPAT